MRKTVFIYRFLNIDKFREKKELKVSVGHQENQVTKENQEIQGKTEKKENVALMELQEAKENQEPMDLAVNIINIS